MKAVIIAGGKGTRMKDISAEIPKPILPVCGKPVLQYQVELLKKYNITEIIIIVNHLKDAIIDFFGKGEKYGVNISYVEEKEPLGTVGGIKEFEHELKDDFIVFYGDVMVSMDLNYFIAFHQNKKSECSIVLHPNDHPYDSDLVEANQDGRITAFHSKPHRQDVYYRNLVNAGVYLFTPVIFKHLVKGVKADFGKNIFPLIYQKIRMYGYDTAEYLKDMGTPDRIAQVEKDCVSGKFKNSNYEYKRKAIFLDRDGVINHENHLVCKPDDFVLFDFTAEAIRKINQTEYVAIAVTNQSVVARNMCTIEEVEYIHKKLETELGRSHAKLDHIYYCPHHPDKGYPEENAEYKIECECRKPKSGMLLNAEKDYHLDLKKSFIIGDAERDIISGRNVGVTTIGVMTGKGMRSTDTQPDYFFPNLQHAVDFIINEPYKIYFEKIYSKFANSPERPFIITIGGNARSGKTTLATYLKKSFEEKNSSVLKIDMDNWLVNEEERKNCKTVFQRFNLEKIISDIPTLFNGKPITVKGYKRHPKQKQYPVTYQFQSEQVIIIEGVVGLSDEVLRSYSHLKIFHDADENMLRSRFLEYYQWRGHTVEQAETLYQTRLKDEIELILKEKLFADMIVAI